MALTPEEEKEYERLKKRFSSQPVPLADRHRKGTQTEDASSVKNLARSAFQGATFGFGDEAIAGVRSALGEDYDTALEDERGQIAAYNRDNPVRSMLTEGIGGLATTGPLALGRAAFTRAAPRIVQDVVGGLSSKFSKLPAVGQGAVIGGGSGAVAGIGQGEGDLSERLPNALPGLGAGFTVGGGLPLAMGAVRGLTGAALTPPSVKAERNLIKDATADGLSIDELGNRLVRDRYVGVPSTIATQGPNLTRRAEGVANLPGEGMKTSRDAIEGIHLGQSERLSQAVHARTGAGDYARKSDDIDAFYRTSATPAYEKAYAVPVNMMDKDIAGVLQLIPKDDLAKASAAAQKVYTSDPLNIGKPPREFFKFKKDGEGNIVDVEFPIDMNTAEWHAFVRGLREVKDGLNKNSAAHAKNFNSAYKDLDRMGKEKNPLFADAQKLYSDTKSIEEAMADGRKAMFSYMTPDEMKKQIAGMSKNEREHYRAGAVQALDEKLARQVDGANKAASLINTGHIRNKLRAITPNRVEFDALMETLQTEARDATARARMTMGSPTASRAEVMRETKADDEFLPQVVEAIKSPTQFASRWLSAKAAGLGMTRKTSDELAPMLHTTNASEQADILKRLRERQAKMIEETERAHTAYRVGAAAFGSGAASPTMERRLSANEETE